MVSHKLPTLARGSWPSEAPSVLRRPSLLQERTKVHCKSSDQTFRAIGSEYWHEKWSTSLSAVGMSLFEPKI